ncbi:uncharacterized protein N7529_005408 [Penicillium soppii]|uniref:uncharacterized protein n=1 Tax=Penicillium soppii TaxID=69789 RepID=UPI002546E02E|nr:uncharacterized protein N7529_005408 [Penicillium soppii]KAJ5873055.1 hypothetical protein N7529_005408 [Penicillium soppii]
MATSGTMESVRWINRWYIKKRKRAETRSDVDHAYEKLRTALGREVAISRKPILKLQDELRLEKSECQTTEELLLDTKDQKMISYY